MCLLCKILKLIENYVLTQVLYLQKKININAKILILTHEIYVNMINFNLKLKKLIAIFFSRINKTLVLLLFL